MKYKVLFHATASWEKVFEASNIRAARSQAQLWARDHVDMPSTITYDGIQTDDALPVMAEWSRQQCERLSISDKQLGELLYRLSIEEIESRTREEVEEDLGLGGREAQA